MTYVFDIDGTLCTLVEGGDYSKAKPLANRIKKINLLFEQGNEIILFTARGMGRTNNNPEEAKNLFFQFTSNQLNEWGVKYSLLFMGKPSGDCYIDDKGVNDGIFFDTKN